MPFEAGPHKIYITPAWAGATEFDAGGTEEGFRWTAELLGEPIRVDQYGRMVVDGIEGGIELQVEISAMEYSDALLAALTYPYSAKPDANNVWHLGVGTVGKLWSASTFKMRVVPLLLPGNQKEFWKCRPMEPIEMLLSGSLPKKIPFRCLVLPDLTKTAGQQLMKQTQVTT